jgi:hypothetical protein
VRVRLALLALIFLAACSTAPPRILVEWTTGSEVNTAGFNLYRSSQPDGPFVRINADLIPASSDPLSGGKYKYEDRAVTPGQTYYYKLEDIELGGAKAEHGPIKITAASDSQSDYWIVLGGGFIIAAVGILIVRARKQAKANTT